MRLLIIYLTSLLMLGCVEKTNPSWEQSSADCRYPWNPCVDGLVCMQTNQDDYACVTRTDESGAALDGTLGADLALQDTGSRIDGFADIQFPEHGHADEVEDEREVHSDLDTMEVLAPALEVTLSFVSGVDFDLHLAHPDAPFWFHRSLDCHFRNPVALWGEEYNRDDDAILLHDDTGSGEARTEETLILRQPELADDYNDRPYRIGVHFYGANDFYAADPPATLVTVQVRLDDDLAYEFSKELSYLDMWQVAELRWTREGGLLTPYPLEASMLACDNLNSCDF